MRGVIIVFLIILAAVLLSGCVNQGESLKTPTTGQAPVQAAEPGITRQDTEKKAGEGEGNVTRTDITEKNASESGRQETVTLNETVTVCLKENPTTGYLWNVTVTSGLSIENDTYVADQVEPWIAGSGGMHYWLLRGTEPGNQSFTAIYKRPWEPEKESDHRFFMNITVV